MEAALSGASLDEFASASGRSRLRRRTPGQPSRMLVVEHADEHK